MRSSRNPHTDFKVVQAGKGKDRVLTNVDTGKKVSGKSYGQTSWYWQPSVLLMNDPSAPGELVFWPNTAAAKENYGLQTYGPDVELEFVFRFMQRRRAKEQPFFVYHTTHLGHDAFDWF